MTIARTLNLNVHTVEQTRKRYAQDGLEAVLQRKPRKDKGIPVKVDGRVEAQLTRLACSQTPNDEPSWTLSMLGDQLVQLGVVDSISRETVRKTLKKNCLKPHLKTQWCIPPEQNAAFVCAMEDVLDVYERSLDVTRPVVCLDGKPCQLLQDVLQPIQPKPGMVKREDSEYERCGTANLFGWVEPLTGKRDMWVTDRRTSVDYGDRTRS